MADRFPAIEDIDENNPAPQSSGADTSDFLARERAALGDDADQFGTPSVQVDNDDLLGNSEEVSQFQRNFPAVNTANERSIPGTVRGISPAPSTYNYAEEPQVIKEWRERRDLAVNAREEKAAARKQETIKEAQNAIDEFYENYNNKVEKGKTHTQKEADEFLAKREDTTSGGTSWERIGKLVDVGRGGKSAAAPGKERFRELLGSLAKDEKAPGAKGY